MHNLVPTDRSAPRAGALELIPAFAVAEPVRIPAATAGRIARFPGISGTRARDLIAGPDTGPRSPATG